MRKGGGGGGGGGWQRGEEPRENVRKGRAGSEWRRNEWEAREKKEEGKGEKTRKRKEIPRRITRMERGERK